MAKDKKGSGIQQAAGLIRYFDEESEDAIQISKGCNIFRLYLILISNLSSTTWRLVVDV